VSDASVHGAIVGKHSSNPPPFPVVPYVVPFACACARGGFAASCQSHSRPAISIDVIFPPSAGTMTTFVLPERSSADPGGTAGAAGALALT
jgi:hypothetical protein